MSAAAETVETWGQRVRRVRRERGVRLVDLAREVGSSQSHLSAVERGWVPAGDELRERIEQWMRCGEREA